MASGRPGRDGRRRAGRRLEHEYLTGAVVEAGTCHRVATLNSAVLALLRGVRAGDSSAAG